MPDNAAKKKRRQSESRQPGKLAGAELGQGSLGQMVEPTSKRILLNLPVPLLGAPLVEPSGKLREVVGWQGLNGALKFLKAHGGVRCHRVQALATLA